MKNKLEVTPISGAVNTSQLIFCDRVILGKQATLREESALLRIENHQITEITALSRSSFEALNLPEVQDLGNRLLGPSFINGHTHLAMSALRGVGLKALQGNVMESLYYVLESELTPEDIRAFVRMGAYESLLSGVTACWDHYYAAEAIASGLQDVGICGTVAPTLQDLGGPGKDHWPQALEATQRILENQSLAAAGIYPVLGPHAADTVSTALWQEVKTLAETHQLSIHCHLSQSLEEYERVLARENCTPVAYLQREGILDVPVPLILVHSLLLTHEDMQRLNPERHILGYCPFSQLQFGFPAPAEQWWQAGFGVQVGTDAGACNDTMNVQQELRSLAGGNGFGVTHSSTYAAFQQEGAFEQAREVYGLRANLLAQRPDNAKILSSVWSVPGESCPALNMGEIAVGKRANLNCWNPNHPALWPATDALRALVMGNTAAALDNVMVNGQWVTPAQKNFHEHVLSSANYAAAQQEATQRLEKLLLRCGLE